MKLTDKINSARNYNKVSRVRTSITKLKPAKDRLDYKKGKRLSKELLEVAQMENVKPLVEFSQEFKEVAAAAELFNSSALPINVYNRDKEKELISSFLSP